MIQSVNEQNKTLINFNKCFDDLSIEINKLSNEKHGFLTGRSTITNLATFKQTIFESFITNAQTDVIYTDFKKAFDRIYHNILISKLKCYGIQNPLLSWFPTFLINRYKIVKYNDFFSNPISITSGGTTGRPYFATIIPTIYKRHFFCIKTY